MSKADMRRCIRKKKPQGKGSWMDLLTVQVDQKGLRKKSLEGGVSVVSSKSEAEPLL